jgi:hypothetical protein
MPRALTVSAMGGAIGQRCVQPKCACGDGCEDLLNEMHAAKRVSDSMCSTGSERCVACLADFGAGA